MSLLVEGSRQGIAVAPPAPSKTAVFYRRPQIRKDTVAVLLPAHNEQEQISDALFSLRHQTRPPEQMVVISDNSTDATIPRARSAGATVIQTVGNSHRKAGALNAGVRYLLTQSYFPEFIVTIDGDSVLERHCLERALRIMRQTPDLGGLSVVCQGKDRLVDWPHWRDFCAGRQGGGVYRHASLSRRLAFVVVWLRTLCTAALMWAQRAEYVRSGFVRLRKNVHTLSGAGSIMRSVAIYELLDTRPDLYREDTRNIVEDFETTLSMKALGWKCANNCYLIAYTDLMPNLRALFRQRMRWVGGTIQELRRRGWKAETRASIVTLVYGYLGVPLFYFWVYLLAHNLSHGAHLRDMWFTAFVGVYQAIGLRRLGARSMFVGLLLIPECLYMVVRHVWLLLSLPCAYLGLLQKW